MWLECFGSFLGLQIDAITKWQNAKDWKTLNNTPITKQKPTNNGFHNTKEHPMFLASSNPLYTYLVA